MRTREITLNVEQQLINVYLLKGFYDFQPVLSDFHKHPLTEIQVVVSGNMRYFDLKTEHEVSSNQMFVIPPYRLHESIYAEPDTRIICFQVGIPVTQPRVISIPNHVALLLMEEIQKFKSTNKSTKLPIYLSLILAELLEERINPTVPVQNRAFLIQDYLTRNFANTPSVSDLSEVLCVSDKQTERLVKKHTGHSFREEIVRLRMQAAEQLITSTNLTLGQVAEKVGYESYSGFWRAYHSFKQDKDSLEEQIPKDLNYIC